MLNDEIQLKIERMKLGDELFDKFYGCSCYYVTNMELCDMVQTFMSQRYNRNWAGQRTLVNIVKGELIC